MENLKACSTCGTAMHHRNPITGEIVDHSFCGVCLNRARQSAAAQERMAVKQHYLKNIGLRMIVRDHPQRQLYSVLASELPDSVKTQAGAKRLPCFVGEAGVGKTWQAVQIAVAIATQLEPVPLAWDECRFAVPDDAIPLFLSAPDLAVRLRSTFNQKGSGLTEQRLLDFYSHAAVLLIDDLGAESTTEYSLSTIYALINGRYAQALRTIITTNLQLDDLARRIGDRCVSRICELCAVVNIAGEDRRLKGLRV